jgi:hypothetical protein
VGDARAPRPADGRAGLPGLRSGSRASTDVGRSSAVADVAPAADARRAAGARAAERDAGTRRPAAASVRARRDLAAPRARGDPPPARVPAPRPAALAADHGTAAVGAAVRRGGGASGGRTADPGGAEHVPGPRAQAPASGAGWVGGRAGASAGDDQPA